jgi:hypothetical protein
MNDYRLRSLHLILFACLILSACNAPIPETPPAATPSEPAPIPANTDVPTGTPEPEPAPTSSPSRVILLVPPENRSPYAQDLQPILAELAGDAGLDFEARTSLGAGDLDPNLRVVVALAPSGGLADLAAAAPQTQFLAIGIAGLEPGANLSAIGGQETEARQQGFLAGYIAAVVTPEWRVGAIGISDTTAGVAARQGFLNGVVYFCGLCRQTYPPFNTYPMYVEAPDGASPAEWQSAADTLKAQAVQTVFLVPGAGDESLVSYLAQAGINLIGNAPPPAAFKGHWIASVRSDFISAFHQVWPDLLAGKGGARLAPALEISDVNSNLLSPGRQRLVEEFITELEAGFIDTGLEDNPP